MIKLLTVLLFCFHRKVCLQSDVFLVSLFVMALNTVKMHNILAWFEFVDKEKSLVQTKMFH